MPTESLLILLVAPPSRVSDSVSAALTGGSPPAQLTHVGRVAEARSALQARKFDLLFCVPALPDGTVRDLLDAAGGVTDHPVVLLLDAPMPQAELNALLDAGLFDYLFLEPAAIRDLPARVRRLTVEWATASGLREKEAFNFALFQHSPVPMVVVDRQGAVLKSNLARRGLDMPLPRLGAPLFSADRGQPEADLAAGLTQALTTGTVQSFPELAWDSRVLNVTLAPFPEGAVVILDDITARKQAQAEAEQRQRQLIQADKMIALGTLVAGVAHEISNPNNVMILGAGLLRRSFTDIFRVLDEYEKREGDFSIDRRAYSEVREELPELADSVLKAAERVRALVDDLKAFARKGSETLDESVDVNAVVEAASKLLHPLIRKACQQFRVETTPGLPPIQGNARNLEQVVLNLLSNACQALPAPDRAIVAATRLDPERAGVLIEVRDQGRGIPPELLARITDPFFTTRHDDGGTGLGLSISRTIVENHQGELRFASVVGEGTVATIYLPITKSRGKP